MPSSPEQLRRDALQIWQAGVDAVRSERLVREALRLDRGDLVVGDQPMPLKPSARVVVVGGGKAGAGMALAVEEILQPLLAQGRVSGWVNVPEDCLRPTRAIHLHAARPAGVNEPTAAGVLGTQKLLDMVGQAGPDDVCLCLISGGGSALLPAPADPITLADKLAVTRFLSAAGATIDQLNAVRKPLSRIKGGGLARACRAGRLAALIISDVLGDPLDVIASGPTVENTSTPAEALAILEHFGGRKAGLPPAIFDSLERRAAGRMPPPACHVTNLIIGNNARAVDAAGLMADRLGYGFTLLSAPRSEGPVEPLGRHLAEMALRMRSGKGSECLVSGGEPVVTLVDAARRGRGGRNQQLVLAATQRLWDDDAHIVLLSGGTDGEDGPTDAAGAFLDQDVLNAARQQGLDPADFLARNDAYNFFQPLSALIKTGPTHTNVCDLRVVLVNRAAGAW